MMLFPCTLKRKKNFSRDSVLVTVLSVMSCSQCKAGAARTFWHDCVSRVGEAAWQGKKTKTKNVVECSCKKKIEDIKRDPLIQQSA